MSTLFLVIFLVTLLILSAFFSISETALFSLPASQLDAFNKSNYKKKKAIVDLLQRPKSLLITILIMNITVNLGVQNVTSSIFGNVSSVLYTVIIPFVLTLVFGEILPKTMAVTKNVSIAIRVTPILAFSSYILTPLRYIFLKITRVTSYLLSFVLKKDTAITKDEIKHALVTSKASGIMTKDEVKLLLGSLRLSEVQVKEVKCPRQNIFFHDIHDDPQKLRDLFTKKRLSKIPIIDRDIDNVIGTINASSFFTSGYSITAAKDLRGLIDPPFFIPESMLSRTLLALFDEKKIEIAFLVDEYGGVSGLITREDLVEIVVGQIKDVREEKTLYTKQGADVIICSGKYELNDLEQIFDLEIQRKGQETTVGGYLLEILGDIPKSGYKVTENNLMFHVLLATEARVSRVYIKNLNKVKTIDE
jgi:putative hemolysin